MNRINRYTKKAHLLLIILSLFVFRLVAAQEVELAGEIVYSSALEIISTQNIQRMSCLINLPFQDAAQHLAWSPSGDILAVATLQELWLYDARNLNQPPQMIADGFDVLGEVVFSPDETQIAVVTTNFAGAVNYLSDPAAIRIFDLETNAQVQVLITDEFSADIAFLKNSHQLVSVDGTDYQIHVWDLTNGIEITQIDTAVLGFPLMLDADFSLQQSIYALATGAQVNTIEGWGVESGERLWETPYGYAAAISFSQDGSLLYGASRYGGSGLIWDVHNREVLHTLDFVNRWVAAADFSADARMFAQIEENPFGDANAKLEIRFWDVERGENLFVRSISETLSEAPDFPLTSSIQLGFSPDGKLLAIGDPANGLTLWGILTQTDGERSCP